MGGGMTLDFLAPMRAVFKRMRQMEKDPRVLDVSSFMYRPAITRTSAGRAMS